MHFFLNFINSFCRSLVLQEEKVPLEQVNKKAGASNALYQGQWKTLAFERTRRNHRQQLKVLINLQHHGTLLTTLQAKFYHLDEVTHSSWGEPLSSVIFECQIVPYSNTINVIKQILI